MGNFSLDIPTVLFCLLLTHLAHHGYSSYLSSLQSFSACTHRQRCLISRLLAGTGVFSHAKPAEDRFLSFYSSNGATLLIFLAFDHWSFPRTLVTLHRSPIQTLLDNIRVMDSF